MIGRDEESECLTSHLTRHERQVLVIYGRRRVGKTTLVTEALEALRTESICTLLKNSPLSLLPSEHWIRWQEPGVSDGCAKKLVSRVIDIMLDLSKHRVAVRKRSQRANGLEYTERRFVVPREVDIPGETAGGA